MGNRGLRIGLPLLLILLAGGCGVPMGGFVTDDPPSDRPEKVYAGLPGQKCAIMVWAPSPIRTEFNQIQLDTARVLQNKLSARLELDKEKESKKPVQPTEFLNPGSVVRFQRENPEIQAMPIVEVAPRLGRSLRLIYIEYDEFQVQSPQSVLLLRGIANVTLRVVEVNDKRAEVVLEEKDIRVYYPKDAPAGVVPNDRLNERTIYEGTITRLADKLAQRFERKK